VHDAFPLGGDLRLAHPRLDDQLAVLHGGGSDLVGEPHSLDLLLGLDRACFAEERCRVVHGCAEGVEPLVRERRRLSDHPVRSLCPERELEPNCPVLRRLLLRDVQGAERRRTRVGRVVASIEPDVRRPRVAAGVLLARLEADEDRLAVAREDAHVVPLHAPEVRQVEDVVGSPDDEGVELALGHQRANALELVVVPRPAHRVNL